LKKNTGPGREGRLEPETSVGSASSILTNFSKEKVVDLYRVRESANEEERTRYGRGERREDTRTSCDVIIRGEKKGGAARFKRIGTLAASESSPRNENKS